MKNGFKILVICFTLMFGIFFESDLVVLASETEETVKDPRENSVPNIYSSSIEIKKKEFWDWFGYKDVPVENCIELIVLTHADADKCDYSLYDLVCDFEMKTLTDEGEIITSTYKYTIDFSHYILGWMIDDIDIFGEDIVSNHYVFGSEMFMHEFNYRNIIKNATGFREEKLDVIGNYYKYNTVISRINFYFIRKSDGNVTEGKSYIFTWDSDFWKQKCTKIEFARYYVDSGNQLYVDSIESINGVDGYGIDNSYDGILDFFIDMPVAIVAFFTGLIGLTNSLKELMLVIFPFLPGGVVNAIILMIVIFIIIAVYKLVQGWFG